MKWEPIECKAGDMVRIRLGSMYHYGIFVSENEVIQFGLPPTAENRAKEGEVAILATDIDTFACGCIVETACPDRSEMKKRLPHEETVRRARARLGETGYNIIHNNCEHFVHECIFGEARCTQEEDVRKRWLNRPICDIYLARIPDDVNGEDIYPEKRKKELDAIADAKLRNRARFLWKLLDLAAQRSFGVDLEHAELKRKLGGKWVSGKFHFSLSSSENSVAGVAVSNAEVGLSLDSMLRDSVNRTLIDPRVLVSVRGKHKISVKYFWADGESSTLMGVHQFE